MDWIGVDGYSTDWTGNPGTAGELFEATVNTLRLIRHCFFTVGVYEVRSCVSIEFLDTITPLLQKILGGEGK